MIRRKLLTFKGSRCDFRVGEGVLAELSPMVRGVVGAPKRALLVHDGAAEGQAGTAVRRALADAGFSVGECALSLEGPLSFARTAELFDALDDAGITADDVLVALGGVELCTVAQFCAASWCGGTSCVLVPTTLDAMVEVATTMRPFATANSPEMVWTEVHPDMVVADVSLLAAQSSDDLKLGYVGLVASAFMDSRRAWDTLGEQLDAIAAGEPMALVEALSQAQTGRANVIKSVNPSARSALSFGLTTARALRACLGTDAPWWRLLAEGMRFEARLGVDAGRLPVDDVFELDDRFEALGIDELTFEVDPERFLEELRATRFKRSNRFLLSIPQVIGSIRYTVVDEDVLERHARAYLASRSTC